MQLVGGLSPRRAEAVRLYVLEGLETDEIAEAMGISKATVQHLLLQAEWQLGAKHRGHMAYLWLRHRANERVANSRT